MYILYIYIHTYLYLYYMHIIRCMYAQCHATASKLLYESQSLSGYIVIYVMIIHIIDLCVGCVAKV